MWLLTSNLNQQILCQTKIDLFLYMDINKGPTWTIRFVEIWKSPENKPVDKNAPRGRSFKPFSDETDF